MRCTECGSVLPSRIIERGSRPTGNRCVQQFPESHCRRRRSVSMRLYPFSNRKPDIPEAEATWTGREEKECFTVPGQRGRAVICGTVQGRAGIDWCRPAI